VVVGEDVHDDIYNRPGSRVVRNYHNNNNNNNRIIIITIIVIGRDYYKQ